MRPALAIFERPWLKSISWFEGSYFQSPYHHSCVDSSTSTILQSQVRSPSTQPTLLPLLVKFYAVFVIELRKRTKINKKRPDLAYFIKQSSYRSFSFQSVFSGTSCGPSSSSTCPPCQTGPSAARWQCPRRRHWNGNNNNKLSRFCRLKMTLTYC